MKNLKQILYLLPVWLLSLSISAQTPDYYVQLEDASGFDTSPYQAELEAAAAELCQLFDSAGFVNQFRVYDFGFYLHQEVTEGGYPEPFAQKITQVQQMSPYYLLFGKQTDKTGVYTRFWVDLKLPDSGIFECIENLVPYFSPTIKQKMSLILIESLPNIEPTKYYNSEIYSITYLKQFIYDKKICCAQNKNKSIAASGCSPCLFTPNEIKSYLRKNKYWEFPISIDSQFEISNSFCDIYNKANNKKGNSNQLTFIYNYVNYPIYVENDTINLYETISSYVPSNNVDSFNIHIMDFNNVVDNSLFEAVEKLKNNHAGLIYFVFNHEDSSFLYISPTAIDVNLYNNKEFMNDFINEEIKCNSCEGCPDWMLNIWNNNYDSSNGTSLWALIITTVLPISSVDGPMPVSDIIAASVSLALAADYTLGWNYITYIVHNDALNQDYCGRSSGFKLDPYQILYRRFKNHNFPIIHTRLDEVAAGPIGRLAIRGREQQNIDYFGGALSEPNRSSVSVCSGEVATCANKIRGVRKDNPLGYLYHYTCNIVFAVERCSYTGYGIQDIEKYSRYFRFK